MSDQTQALLARHHALVDKKYLDGLSEEEERELVQVDKAISDADAPIYEPIIERLSFRSQLWRRVRLTSS